MKNFKMYFVYLIFMIAIMGWVNGNPNEGEEIHQSTKTIPEQQGIFSYKLKQKPHEHGILCHGGLHEHQGHQGRGFSTNLFGRSVSSDEDDELEDISSNANRDIVRSDNDEEEFKHHHKTGSFNDVFTKKQMGHKGKHGDFDEQHNEEPNNEDSHPSPRHHTTFHHSHELHLSHEKAHHHSSNHHLAEDQPSPYRPPDNQYPHQQNVHFSHDVGFDGHLHHHTSESPLHGLAKLFPPKKHGIHIHKDVTIKTFRSGGEDNEDPEDNNEDP